MTMKRTHLEYKKVWEEPIAWFSLILHELQIKRKDYGGYTNTQTAR
jgi:hypothetical protein